MNDTQKVLDPNDAPEGYTAEEATDTCTGCAFDSDSLAPCGQIHRCLSYDREDGHSVVFVKKPDLFGIFARNYGQSAPTDTSLASLNSACAPMYKLPPLVHTELDYGETKIDPAPAGVLQVLCETVTKLTRLQLAKAPDLRVDEFAPRLLDRLIRVYQDTNQGG